MIIFSCCYNKNWFRGGSAAVYLSSACNEYVYRYFVIRDKVYNFKVKAVCPGFTKDFNGHRGTGTLEAAGKRTIKYTLIDKGGPTGKF
ncbi:hypothetical protein [Chryseobacterium sp. W4I1]|uniref:hypothetical protein n=1 Tax=Chryseobacterium sp. W4I1 TaxID=3042293 RepID=UPI00277F0623|nr:hypothetical protein [Chryseobacterium sp. W4I1]MDQ0782534.1 hypothetical protein [Chryseobacterium sp. W4I1]